MVQLRDALWNKFQLLLPSAAPLKPSNEGEAYYFRRATRALGSYVNIALLLNEYLFGFEADIVIRVSPPLIIVRTH
jgi:hypothetical protein